MRQKMIVFAVIFILSTCLAGCSNYGIKNEPAIESSIETSASTVEDAKKEESDIPDNTSEPFIGRKDLDSETEKFFYGTWSVEKLLGFADSYNDASEYPTGQKIIGNQIIIDKDFFTSKGFEGYKTYQFELDTPIYDIEEIHYNADSFYRVDNIDLKSLNMNDEVKVLSVSDSSTGLAIPVSFLDVNNDRLLLVLEATVFELKRITEASPTPDATVTANSAQPSDSGSPQSEADVMSGSEIDKNTIDIEKVEAVIADDCNSVFEGKIGTQNVCIAIYRDEDLLTASYITQNDQDSEINLQGTIQTNTASFVLNSKDGATFVGTIEPETQKGTLLEGTYTSATNGEDTKFALALSHTIGNTYESRYPLTSANTKDIEEFANKIKLYITENNKAGLADLIAYPIKVAINGSKVLINNKKEFEQRYNDIINAEFKEKINNCYTKYLFSNYMGVMLGNGEVWFESFNNNGLRVYAINN